MRYKHLLAAAAVVAVGCSDYPTGTGGGTADGSRYFPQELTGKVTVDEVLGTTGVVLSMPGGATVVLAGPEGERLRQLVGFDVRVRGSWEGSVMPIPDPTYVDDISYRIDDTRSAFLVESFVVLAVEGQPALDGILSEESGRLYLQLDRGEVHWFDDPPAELAALIAKRIWVTGAEAAEEPLRFAEIE